MYRTALSDIAVSMFDGHSMNGIKQANVILGLRGIGIRRNDVICSSTDRRIESAETVVFRITFIV